jgi:hypothetical protein
MFNNCVEIINKVTCRTSNELSEKKKEYHTKPITQHNTTRRATFGPPISTPSPVCTTTQFIWTHHTSHHPSGPQPSIFWRHCRLFQPTDTDGGDGVRYFSNLGSSLFFVTNNLFSSFCRCKHGQLRQS